MAKRAGQFDEEDDSGSISKKARQSDEERVSVSTFAIWNEGEAAYFFYVLDKEIDESMRNTANKHHNFKLIKHPARSKLLDFILDKGVEIENGYIEADENNMIISRSYSIFSDF